MHGSILHRNDISGIGDHLLNEPNEQHTREARVPLHSHAATVVANKENLGSIKSIDEPLLHNEV